MQHNDKVAPANSSSFAEVDDNSKCRIQVPHDEFAWLRAPDWPKVAKEGNNLPIIDFLHKANEDFAKFMAAHTEKKAAIADKIAKLSQENNYTVPFIENGYYYFSRIEEGQDYWTHFRKPASYPNLTAAELEVMRESSASGYADYLRSLLELERPVADLREFVLLDEIAMAATSPSSYFCLDSYVVSPNNEFVAYAVDNKGDERYDLYLRRIADGAECKFVTGVWPNFVWKYDSSGLYYVPCGEDWRALQVWYKPLHSREIGGDFPDEVSTSSLIYEEKDRSFNVSLAVSRSKSFVYINCKSHTHNEVLLMVNCAPEHMPDSWREVGGNMFKNGNKPLPVIPREPTIKYSLSENADFFFIITNDLGDNCRLVAMSIEKWLHLVQSKLINDKLAEGVKANLYKIFQQLIGVSQDFIDELQVSGDKLIVKFTYAGIPSLKMFHVKHSKNSEHFTASKLSVDLLKELAFPDPAYTLNLLEVGDTMQEMRYAYSSPACPPEIWGISCVSLRSQLLKQNEFWGFNKDDYMVERHYVRSDYRAQFLVHSEAREFLDQSAAIAEKFENKAESEEAIPVTIVYHCEKFGLNKAGKQKPLLLYGYGAYGLGVTAHFRASIVPLLDAGFVYAIAHVRGGDERGFAWHKAGKLLQKKRSFEDFADVSCYLIDKDYTKAGDISIMGGSAGGMLVGYMVNNYAKLLRAALALVPFVDVLNTMLDPTLPLTQDEYQEWGNPEETEYYNYIAGYSPYENVAPQHYPHIMATAGFQDPRVGYWEAAKWYARIAKLRHNKKMLFLKTDMSAGHMGQNARRDAYEEMAEYWIFLLASYALI